MLPERIRPHLPSLAEARAQTTAPMRELFRTVDLLKRKPVALRRWAAVELVARFAFREERRERHEVPASTLIGQRPPLREGFEEGHVTWVRAMEPEVHACTACSFSPGEQQCLVCGGSGWHDPTAQAGTCSFCGGSGHVRCALCNGERRVSWAQLVFTSDSTETIRRVFLPIERRGSSGACTLRVRLETNPAPDVLRFSDRELFSENYT